MIRMIGVGDNVVDKYTHLKTIFPGGNCVNFAVYGKMMGHETAYMGVLGDDMEAQVLTDALTALGIDYSKSEFVHGETGVCSTRLINGDRVITDDNDLGAVKSTPLNLTEERLSYISGFDIAHSSCYSFIDDQLHKIKALGIPVSYDFSDIWEVADLARVCPDIDIAFFSGKKLPDDTLKELLRQAVHEHGCKLAITTIGKRGAIIYAGKRFHSIKPYNLGGAVVDTLGAGDSFFTGFITSYIEGVKRFEAVTKKDAASCTDEEDRDAYWDALIEYSMNVANLLAAKNCMVNGAFGHGRKYE